MSHNAECMEIKDDFNSYYMQIHTSSYYNRVSTWLMKWDVKCVINHDNTFILDLYYESCQIKSTFVYIGGDQKPQSNGAQSEKPDE